MATTNRIMSSESKASSSSVCLPTGDDHGRRKALHPRPDVRQDLAIGVFAFERTTTQKVSADSFWVEAMRRCRHQIPI